MFTKQVSIFLENKKGRLAEVTKLLTEEGINIRALSLADTASFGVLRIIVNDRPRCLRVLREQGLVVQETDVIAVEIEDKAGSLHSMVEILECEGMNIEYMYAFLEKKESNAIVVFKIDDGRRTVETLRNCGYATVPDDLIEKL